MILSFADALIQLIIGLAPAFMVVVTGAIIFSWLRVIADAFSARWF